MYDTFGVPMSCTNIGKHSVQSYRKDGRRSWKGGGLTKYFYIILRSYKKNNRKKIIVKLYISQLIYFEISKL